MKKVNLFDACKTGDTQTIKRLLNEGEIDPPDWNNEAIQWASHNGHLEIVKLLKQDRRVQKKLLIDKVKKL